tara:strand:+ start:25403 stop:29626 length:4224 start_codon:yes stop_codon:yes gene_type:complete
MPEPITMTTLAVGALSAITSGIIGGGSQYLSTQALQKQIRQFQRQREEGKLPQNHYIERATVRAGLQASRISIQRLLDDGLEKLLDDNNPSAPSAGVRRSQHRSRTRLIKKLNRLIINLEPDVKNGGGPLNAKAAEKAVISGRLPISGASLDMTGTRTIGAMYQPVPNDAADSVKDLESSVREARFSLLPELESAVIDQLIRFGAWEGADRSREVAAALRANLFGRSEAWMINFGLCYAAEVRADNNLEKLVVLLRLERLDAALAKIGESQDAFETRLNTLVRSSEDGFRHLQRDTSRILVLLEALSQAGLPRSEALSASGPQSSPHLKLHDRDMFSEPGLSSTSVARSAFNSFYFAEEEDEFIGREDVVEQICEKLLDPAPGETGFRWAAICGEAGTGKSRLALHLLNTFGEAWPVRGFVRPQFIRDAPALLADFSQLAGPTLFVIDYAGNAPVDCCRFLEHCARLAGNSPYPVRVLILIRRSNDRFFETISEQRDGPQAANSQVEFSVQAGARDASGALLLRGLSEAETLTLMKRRIQLTLDETGATGGDTPDGVADDQQLISILKSYDSALRPLFALILADGIARGLIREKPDGPNQEADRLKLLWDYLEHQYNRRWQSLAKADSKLEEDAGNQIDRHLTFLMLSTACQGLTDEGWARVLDDASLHSSAQHLLPGHPLRFETKAMPAGPVLDEQHLLAALAGKRRADKSRDPYPILEPDLIGESLILLAHDDQRNGLCVEDATQKRRREFLSDYAWKADPAGASLFSVLVAQDFPERAAQLNWLLPKERSLDNSFERASLLRRLVLVTAAPLRYRAAEISDLKRFQALLEAFPPEPGETEAVQIERAEAVRQVAQQLAFVVNKSLVPTLRLDAETITDKSGRERSVFAKAAEVQGGGADPASSNAGDKEIYKLASKQGAIDMALKMLRELGEASALISFSEASFEIRRVHSQILYHMIATVYWQYRNVRGRHGYARHPLSKAECAERERLAQLSLRSFPWFNAHEDNVAIASGIIHGIIYAENGEVAGRGEPAFRVIRRLARRQKFTKARTISSALNFLSNHVANIVMSAESVDAKKRPTKIDSFLEAVISVADNLFDAATKLPEIDEVTHRRIIGNWFNVTVRIANIKAKEGADVAPVLANCLNRYDAYKERHGGIALTNDMISTFTSLIKGLGAPLVDAERVRRAYMGLVRKFGFDRNLLKSPGYNSLYAHWPVLFLHADDYGPDLFEVLEKACEQAGEAARMALAEALRDFLPRNDVSVEWAETVAAITYGGNQRLWPAGLRSELDAGLLAHRLLNGAGSEVFDGLEWPSRDAPDESALVRQTSILQQLWLLVHWFGAADPTVQIWREKLLTSLKAEPQIPTSHLSQSRKEYRATAMALAGLLIKLEMTIGQPIDDWILVE